MGQRTRRERRAAGWPGRTALQSSAAALALALLSTACAKSAQAWHAELTDADPYARGMAAIGLCYDAPDQAVDAAPVLFELLRTPGLELQEVARRALQHATLHDPAAMLRLATHGPQMELDARGVVLDALAAAGGAAVPAVVGAMHDPGRANPRLLTGILVEIGEPSIDALIELLAHDPDRIVRASAAWGLGQIGPRAKRALPGLESAAEHADALVSRNAIQALPLVDGSGLRALPILRRALASSDRSASEAAADALTRFQLAHASIASPRERGAAVVEIVRAGDDALPALVQALDDPLPQTAGMAEACLALVIARFELRNAWCTSGASGAHLAPVDTSPLETQTSVLVLTRHSLPGSEVKRGLAALKLARLGKRSVAALPLLVFALSDSFRSVRWCAAWAIFSIVVDESGVLSSWRPWFFGR